MTDSHCRAKDPSTCVHHAHQKSKAEIQQSKRLSYVLRHDPASVGLTLQPGGWIGLQALAKATGIAQKQIRRLASLDEKQRFTVERGRIRAAQGHSIQVDLGRADVQPPPVLYHGTVQSSLASIFATGLQPRQRHAVHLSDSVATASQVGARRGAPVILAVASGRMHADGHHFQQADNGVWLTAHVPSAYLTVQR